MDGKKKNKKRKNKQNKTTDVSTSGTTQKNSKDDNNGDFPEQNHQNKTTMETQGVSHLNQSSGAEEDAVEYDMHQSANSNVGSLKGYTEQLLRDKQLQIHKEAELHGKIRKMQEENEHLYQKQANLEIKVGELQKEKESWHQKEIALESNIGQLMQEKAVLCSTEEKVKALEEERVSWIRKEEKVKALEEERVSWLRKEVSSKEMISSLSNDVSRLQVQVTELEESKRNLFLENQQMAYKLSALQSRNQELEGSLVSDQASADFIPKDDDNASKSENLKAEMDSACALIENLVSENAELVEKVNELYMELSRLDLDASRQDGSSSVFVPVSSSLAGNTDATSGSGLNVNEVSNESIGTVYASPVNGEKTNIREHSDFAYSSTEIQESSETSAGGEIVQIPLDEKEVVDLEGQSLIKQEIEAVSLTDAPLIGAPFRLISFFASYVSGADLVEKDSNAGH